MYDPLILPLSLNSTNYKTYGLLWAACRLAEAVGTGLFFLMIVMKECSAVGILMDIFYAPESICCLFLTHCDISHILVSYFIIYQIRVFFIHNLVIKEEGFS